MTRLRVGPRQAPGRLHRCSAPNPQAHSSRRLGAGPSKALTLPARHNPANRLSRTRAVSHAGPSVVGRDGLILLRPCDLRQIHPLPPTYRVAARLPPG